MSKTYEEYQKMYRDNTFTCFMSKPESTPVAMYGENDTIFIMDETGETKPYIDGNSGCFGPITIGYGNEYQVEAIYKQAKKMIHQMSPATIADVVLELSEKLAAVSPEGFNNSFLSTAGSLAVEAAMHICWQATGKRGAIALTGAFHGWTYATRSITSYRPFKLGFGAMPGVAFLPRPYCYRCPYKLEHPSCGLHCAHALRDLVKYGGGYDSGFIIMEPIQGFGGHVTPPSKEYFKVIRKICDEYGMMLVIDEVQTGMGKTGKLFATELYEIPADIIVLGKGLGGGIATGVVVLHDKAIEHLQKNYNPEMQTDKIFYGTNAMDPIVAASGVAVLEYIQKNNLVERSRRLGDYLMEKLLEIQKESLIIGDVRGPGLYKGVEFVKDRDTKESNPEGTQQFLDFAREQGVMFQAGGEEWSVLKIKPPLTIEEKNLDKIIEVVRDGVKAVEKGMKASHKSFVINK